MLRTLSSHLPIPCHCCWANQAGLRGTPARLPFPLLFPLTTLALPPPTWKQPKLVSPYSLSISFSFRIRGPRPQASLTPGKNSHSFCVRKVTIDPQHQQPPSVFSIGHFCLLPDSCHPLEQYSTHSRLLMNICQTNEWNGLLWLFRGL